MVCKRCNNALSQLYFPIFLNILSNCTNTFNPPFENNGKICENRTCLQWNLFLKGNIMF